MFPLPRLTNSSSSLSPSLMVGTATSYSRISLESLTHHRQQDSPPYLSILLPIYVWLFPSLSLWLKAFRILPVLFFSDSPCLHICACLSTYLCLFLCGSPCFLLACLSTYICLFLCGSPCFLLACLSTCSYANLPAFVFLFFYLSLLLLMRISLPLCFYFSTYLCLFLCESPCLCVPIFLPISASSSLSFLLMDSKLLMCHNIAYSVQSSRIMVLFSGR